MLANESVSRGNALPVRAPVKHGRSVSAGAGEAPPCSALHPGSPALGAAGGTRAMAGELVLPGHSSQDSGRGVCASSRPSGATGPEQQVTVPWGCSMLLATACARDRLRWTPQPCLLGVWRGPPTPALLAWGAEGTPSPAPAHHPCGAEHISIPGSRVQPRGGRSSREGIEGGLAV